ncbi:hypothetical protein TNCV_2033761 [Trichonephila clavipes]|nr:hypothetical protein TNCV_2033761 [Trichonephila clavipes]
MTSGVPKHEIQPLVCYLLLFLLECQELEMHTSIHRLYRSTIVKQKRNPSDDEKSYGKKESLLTHDPFPVPLLYLRNQLLVEDAIRLFETVHQQ